MVVKQGDLVSTPFGLGKFFELKQEDSTIALIRLKEQQEGAKWTAVLGPDSHRMPVIECIPLNEVPLKDIKVEKTVEEQAIEAERMKRAAYEEAMRAHAQQQKAYAEAMRKQREQQNS